MASFAPMRNITSSASRLFSSIPTILPHRIRRKFRSTRSKIRTRASPTSSVTTLETSYSPADTLSALKAHQWSAWDAQYILLAVLGIFALCVIEHPGPLVKFVAATGLMTSILLPVTRQFFLPFLPIISWLVFFYACGYEHTVWELKESG